MSTKERILDSAQTLFAMKGYDRASAAEIAARAGVSQGIIFHHFKTKENLLYQVSIRVLGNLLDQIRHKLEEPGRGLDILERALRHYLAFVTDREEKYRALLRTTPMQNLEADTKSRGEVAKMFCTVVKLIESCLIKGIEDGSIRAGIEPEKYAYVIFQQLVGYGRIKLMLFKEPPDLSEETVEFCLISLRA